MAKHKGPAHKAQKGMKKRRPAAMMMPGMPPADMDMAPMMPSAKAPARKPTKKRKKARRK